jgi:hypothetical protein
MLYKDTNVISAIDLTTVYKKDITEQYRVYSDIIWNLSDKNIRIFKAIST